MLTLILFSTYYINTVNNIVVFVLIASLDFFLKRKEKLRKTSKNFYN